MLVLAEANPRSRRSLPSASAAHEQCGSENCEHPSHSSPLLEIHLWILAALYCYVVVPAPCLNPRMPERPRQSLCLAALRLRSPQIKECPVPHPR